LFDLVPPFFITRVSGMDIELNDLEKEPSKLQGSFLMFFLYKVEPMAVTELSSVFACSNTEIMGSNST
jgi:hypothetical protein